MQLMGYLMQGLVVLSSDGSGRPVVPTDPPVAPEGYRAASQWVDDGSQIIQTWRLDPVEGTAAEAALALSRMQFMSLPDDAAYGLRALAPEWINGESYTGPDDPGGLVQSRVRYRGRLYKCLQSHVAQEDWTPDAAPSLWAEILPGQAGNTPGDGTIPEWERPGSTNGYATGDRVTHNGVVWESTIDNNVWEPGATGTENLWKQIPTMEDA